MPSIPCAHELPCTSIPLGVEALPQNVRTGVSNKADQLAYQPVAFLWLRDPRWPTEADGKTQQLGVGAAHVRRLGF